MTEPRLIFFLLTLCSAYSCRTIKLQRQKIESLQVEIKAKDSLSQSLTKQVELVEFRLASANLRIKELSSNDNPASIENYLPIIPCPPPLPTANSLLSTKLVSKLATYHELDSLLVENFKRNGYNNYFYLAVQHGGFAIATPVEEINSDGTVRRNEITDNNANSSFLRHLFSGTHLAEQFFSKTGYYRIIIILASPNLYNFNGKKLSFEILDQWASVKSFRLPVSISQKKIEPDIQLLAVLYEFEQNENAEKKVQIIDAKKIKTQFLELPLLKKLLE